MSVESGSIEQVIKTTPCLLFAKGQPKSPPPSPHMLKLLVTGAELRANQWGGGHPRGSDFANAPYLTIRMASAPLLHYP